MLKWLLIFISLQTLGQSRLNHQADSLRTIGFYEEELALRSKELSTDKFDLTLAKANLLISKNETEKAITLLNKLKPNNPEETFWKGRSLALYYRKTENTTESIKILSQLSPSQHLHKAIIQLDLGQTYAASQEQIKAIEHLEAAANLLSNKYLLGLTYSDLSFAYDAAGIRNKTSEYGDKALKTFMQYHPEAFSMVSSLHNNLLFFVIEYGDEKLAREVQKSYVSYMKSRYPKQAKAIDQTHAQALHLLSNIRYAGFTKNEEFSLQNLTLLENLFQQAPKEWTSNNLGILSAGYEAVQYYLRKQKKFDKALAFAEKVNKVEQAPYNQMKKYAALALTQYDCNQNHEALKNVDLCMASFEFQKGSKSYQTLMVLKAELLSRLGRTQEAKNVLNDIYKEAVGQSIMTVNIKDFPQHYNKIFIDLLIHSGWVYQNIYRLNGKKDTDYQTAKHFFRLAAQVFEEYYQNGIYNNSLGEIIDQIEDGLLFEHQRLTQKELLNDINLLETISNTHLWNKFSSKYIQNLNLPERELEAKNKLQLKRNILTRTYDNELKNQAEILKIDRLIHGIDNSISKKSSAFSKMTATDFELRKIQKELNKTKAVIKFSLTEKNVYAYVITSETVKPVLLGSLQEIDQLSQNYANSLSKIKADYPRHRKALEQKIIKPLNISSFSHLVFIPDGFLSYIPFETLLNEQQRVSYHFSLKGLTVKTNQKLQQGLAGVVPSYASSNALSELKYSIKELESIKNLFKTTDVFTNENATKEAFIKSLGNYGIHHLAMHSEMDEEDYENSSLVFSDYERLYFHEIYSLNFPSELVVLSACNTGLGKYLNGEGLMSLARSLNYAGVKSSVTSLWQVPDKETAELMKYFYQYLTQGKDKDEALMLAKRSFTNANPMKAHPYYWAGFILTGETDAISNPSKKVYYYGAGIIALLIVMLVLRRNKPLWTKSP